MTRAALLLLAALALGAAPATGADVRQSARAAAAQGKPGEAIVAWRTVVRLFPDDDEALLALGSQLSWRKDRAALEESIPLFDRYLARNPWDGPALLQRARAHAWTGDTARAARDYRAYLGRHPDDDVVLLELGRTLSWSKVRADVEASLAVFDRYLARHPDSGDAVLARARAAAWAGRAVEAETALLAYAEAHPGDDAALREAATIVAQGKDPARAVPLFERYLARHPDDFEAEARRARALLWSGAYGDAEPALSAARARAPSDRARDDIDVDRARLLAQTGRRPEALDLLEEVLVRAPGHAGARQERERVSVAYRSRITPGVTTFGDKSGIFIVATSLSSAVHLSRDLAVLMDVGAWRLGNRAETLWTGRANAGLWTRPGGSFELELQGGPRLYQHFAPAFGGRVSAKMRPARWLGGQLEYAYDDIYVDLMQPASVAAGIRAHALSLAPEIAVGPLLASGRVGSHIATGENRSFEATGTATVLIVRPIRVGYNAQWLSWSYNDPAYWSPQAYAAHLGVVRAAQDLGVGGGRLAYDAQVALGTAAERITAVPSSGYGVAWGASLALLWAPTTTVAVRVSAQYGETVRRVLPLATRAGAGAAPAAPAPGPQSNNYYWLTATAAVTFTL